MDNQNIKPNKRQQRELDDHGSRGDRKSGRNQRGGRRPKEKLEFETKMLDLARVTRVTKGGKRFSFRATVVIGDGKGMAGVGIAQGRDVQQAMQKATSQARKASILVPLVKGGTIAHEVRTKYHGAKVIIKPAGIGNGVKAGGPVRVIASLVGIENLTAKLIARTNNKGNIARATLKALSQL